MNGRATTWGVFKAYAFFFRNKVIRIFQGVNLLSVSSVDDYDYYGFV